MKLYNELADWWHLLSPVEEYEEEANEYIRLIKKYAPNTKTVLELGAGGGNNAFYLKNHFDMTLTDIAPAMLEQSKKINPECDHIQADMKDFDLKKKFDAIFIHDAIYYITEEDMLTKIIKQAFDHLNINGLLFIVPDVYAEHIQQQQSAEGVTVTMEEAYDTSNGPTKLKIQTS